MTTKGGANEISLGLWEDAASRSAAGNMACDEVLLRTAVGPVLRVYGWRQPALSLGYFVPWDDAFAGMGRELVRRWTGGGLVMHEPDGSAPTYSLVIPRGHPWYSLRPRGLYERVHAALAEVLLRCGIPAKQHRDTAHPAGGWCFRAPTVHDLTAMDDGRKLAGAGQRRTAAGVLFQGCVRAKLPKEWPLWMSEALDPGWRVAPLDELWPMDAKIEICVRERYGRDSWLKREMRHGAVYGSSPE